jgi:alpha-glucosidase
MGSRARQLALATIIDSPLLCLPDSPKNYRGQLGLEYFRDRPTVWDETRVLSADLAEHLVEARRKGDTWVVAAMNNDKPLTLKVPLDFLKPGDYTVRVFADKPESATVATAITDETRVMKAGDVLEIPMVIHGGFAAKITPQK